jgi:tripartite-type tricarboxylate transporter receptor subunit TctC
MKGSIMKFRRRQFLHLAAGAAALPAVSRMAMADTYPARPITMIVPYAIGGPADAIARTLADRMGASTASIHSDLCWRPAGTREDTSGLCCP